MVNKTNIRFPLEMENEVKVRSLEELRANFSLEKVIEHYYNKDKLANWLDAQNLSEAAENIRNLRGDSPDFYANLCKILDIDYDKYVKDTEEREKELLKNIHVCHSLSKTESGKTSTTYGIFLKEMNTGNVTEAVSFTDNELLKDRLDKKIWYERHGQWVLYLKTNQVEQNAAQTYSFCSYNILTHKEKILCEQLPASDTCYPDIYLHIYSVNREHILWQCNDTLYLTQYNKQMQIYSNPQSDKRALCLHPDFCGIHYRMNSAITSRGILFTVADVVNPIEKTLYYFARLTHDVTSLATGRSISISVENNDKLYFSMNGSLFFVDEEELEICEICPLRDNAESSDRLESIHENGDYIVWIVREHQESNKGLTKFLECYTKQERTRKELEQFEGGFTDNGIQSQSEITLTSDKICCKEFAMNYAGEIFAEKEKTVGYDGTGKTAWDMTMENREWTSVDAGSNGPAVVPLESIDELPLCVSEYLIERQEMMDESEKMREKLRQDGFVVSELQVP